MVDVPLADPPSGVDLADWLDACNTVRDYCGWHVAPVVNETLTLDGPGGDLLVLPTLHVVDVVSITSDGTAVTDPQWSPIGTVRYCYWSCKPRSIVVELSHGLEKAPAGLVAIAKELVESPLGAERLLSRQRGPFSETYDPADSRRENALNRWRLPRLA